MRECATCRADVAAMRSVRDDLTSWDTPEPAFGFRLVPDGKPSWRSWWTPAFGMAAAAMLLLAAASAIANFEVRYDGNGLTVKTGWNRPAQATANAVALPVSAQPARFLRRAWTRPRSPHSSIA